LEKQELSADKLPHLLDKCIKYIEGNGMRTLLISFLRCLLCIILIIKSSNRAIYYWNLII